MVSYDPNNAFAKILRGEIPCQKVLEDEFFLAFHDIAPKAPIHVLVIPKREYQDFFNFTTFASSAEIIGFYKGACLVIEHLKLEKGYRIVSNTGPHGGQEVPHYHLHILGGEVLGPTISCFF